MFDPEGFPELQSVYWRNLRPGMVFVGGVTVNDSVPPELRGAPVLSAALLEALSSRYALLRDRSVLIYAPGPSHLSAVEISDRLRDGARTVETLNGFRGAFRDMRAELLGDDGAGARALDSPCVRADSLILNHWASGIRVFDSPRARPSLLSNLKAAVNLADILSGAASGTFRFPKERPFQLHVLVDASYSMKATGRDELVRGTLSLFNTWIRALFPAAQCHWHAFSEACTAVMPPFTAYGLARGETRYEAFVRRVLHLRSRDMPATVLLFTDGLPSDHAAAVDHLRRFARQGIDYTQIVFRIAEEGVGTVAEGTRVLDGHRVDEGDPVAPLPPEEQARESERVRGEFSALAMAAGGNQVILTLDRALGVIAVEAFDEWLGAFSPN